jgi:hypothetical protein
MPSPHFEREKERRGDDVFKSPYNPNLYVGELQDANEDEGTEYVVLVSELVLSYLRTELTLFVVCCIDYSRTLALLHPVPHCALSMYALVAQQVLCR